MANKMLSTAPLAGSVKGRAAKRLAARVTGRPVPFLPDGRDLVIAVNNDNYPGVVCALGADRRLIVNGRGNRYQLQFSVLFDRGRFWRGEFWLATKSALLAKFADDTFLAGALAAYPEKPADLAPALTAERKRQAAAFLASDTGRDDYPGVVARCEDWRLVADPDGSRYRLMFVHREYFDPTVGHGFNMWISAVAWPELSHIVSCIEKAAGGGHFGTFSELWYSAPDKLLPDLAALPLFASDCDLAGLVARPISVKRQNRAKPSR